MKNKFLILALFCFTFTGCHFWPSKAEPGGKPTQATELNVATDNTTQAISAADAAQAIKDSKTNELLGKVKANVISAKTSNLGNPEGIAKIKVDGELTVAEQRLSGVAVDQVEVAAAATRDLLVEQGKLSEARKAYDKAADEGKEKAKELEQANIDTALAISERDLARSKEIAAKLAYEAAMVKNQEAFNKQLEDAHNEVMKDQVHTLNLVGAGCMLLFALGLGFGGPAGLKMTWPFGLLGLFAFGLAQIVGLWWFKWAMATILAIIVCVAAWWIWQQYHRGVLHQKMTEKANQLQGVLSEVVPVLDKAYENAESTTKELLDKTIFDPLSKKLDKSDKSLVHVIRANGTSETST